MKRALYLGYYLRQLDRGKFATFLNHARMESGRSRISLAADVVKSVFVNNISLLEYFQFHFYELSEQEREAWAGTGHMYEYQLLMNPKSSRHILENKSQFYKYYQEFLVHEAAGIEDLADDPGRADALLANRSGKLVFKPADGNCGAEVEIRRCDEFDRTSMLRFMKDNRYGVVEEFIIQHPEMNRLSPAAVNTVRIFTQLNERGGVDILGCRLRISINTPVDNMAAGNMAAPIDGDTGRLSGPGVFSDITKPEQEYHPVTHVRIPGFQIPFWEEILEMVKKAAQLHPQNRSIGWDVVVTENGPGLIEGNHDWCKLVWQLPVKKGLKSALIGIN